MKLIIVLVCLGLERYLGIGPMLKRFNWFDYYLNTLKSTIKTPSLWQGYAGVATSLLPFLLIVVIIYGISIHFFHDAMRMLLGLVIFLYCLGPQDFYQVIQRYFTAREVNDVSSGEQLAKEFLSQNQIPSDEPELNRTITKAIFNLSIKRILGVTIWFVILGPIGALLYRLSTLLNERTNEFEPSMQEATQKFALIMDWIPVRVVSLLFSLAGNFSQAFGEWVKSLNKKLDYNESLLINCGLHAIDQDAEKNSGEFKENRAALTLVDRTLIIILALATIFTLGALIY